ncbi:MAG: molecular chaperone DnaK, partial [Candidatus Cloacimonetes bacterium]|nr:molecular chaperone DnaK [Candidatus Cloacimonadota bacterium]
LSDSEKNELQDELKSAKEQMEKATESEQMNSIKENLAKKAQKLGEIIYANMQQQQGAGGGAGFDPNAGGFNPEDFAQGAQQQEAPKQDGPIDADFEVMDDK